MPISRRGVQQIANCGCIRFQRPYILCWRLNSTLPSIQRLRLSTSPAKQSSDAPQREGDVAILGGGITGLTTAYYLATRRPELSIDLFERQKRTGGWMQAHEQTSPEGRKILFEQGPRTLRTAGLNAKLALTLVAELGLEGEVEVCSKKSPMAQNRYVYLNNKLDRMPSSLWEVAKRIIFDPAWTDLGRNVLLESYRERSAVQQDVPVAEFLEQRAGKHAALLASAMMHGIYAGDAWKLSVKSLMPMMLELESRWGNVVRGYLRDNSLSTSKDIALTKQLDSGEHTAFIQAMSSASIFYFKGGLQTLARTIERKLESLPNVRIFKQAEATKVARSSVSKALEIQFKSGESKHYQKAISALPSQRIAAITDGKLSALAEIPAATVMVLNLYFSNPNLIKNYQGFGYLIPQSKIRDQNPGNILGVIFDSCVTPRLDAATDDAAATPGTKITVMMGGHYWNERTSYPSDDEALITALLTLKSHLGITDFPSNYKITLQKDCIAQYNVGHGKRLADGHDQLKDEFDGRLAVLGSSYTGVGVNDCIRAAYDIAAELERDEYCTGLESAAGPTSWVSGYDVYKKV